jgi:hypothetical protein
MRHWVDNQGLDQLGAHKLSESAGVPPAGMAHHSAAADRNMTDGADTSGDHEYADADGARLVKLPNSNGKRQTDQLSYRAHRVRRFIIRAWRLSHANSQPPAAPSRAPLRRHP